MAVLRSARADPLEQRRAAEHVEVNRIRMPLEADIRRWRSGWQSVPVASETRRATHIDDAQRFETFGAFLHAGVQDDQHGERKQQQYGQTECRDGAAKPEPPDEGGHRRQKGSKPEARQHCRSSPLLVAQPRITLLPLDITRLRAFGHRYSTASNRASRVRCRQSPFVSDDQRRADASTPEAGAGDGVSTRW